MNSIRIILIGIFLLSSIGYSIQNKDIIGDWRISEDNEQRLSYPALRLESDSLVTLINQLDTLDTGKFCTCAGGLSLNLSQANENLKIIHFSKDTLILSGFSFRLVLGDFKFKDTVTYVRYNR